MLYGLYISSAGLAANQLRQDVAANNLANVETTGFKADLAVFMERLPAWSSGSGGDYVLPNLTHASGGIFAGPTQTDFSQGAFQQTDRNLDVAVDGDGFLLVRDGGETRYSRDGRLAVRNGLLVRQIDGKAVLDEKGEEIHLGDIAEDQVRIGGNGAVLVDGEQAGQLGLVRFEDPQVLRKQAGNLFANVGSSGAGPVASSALLRSGHLEKSIVDPATMLIEMIAAARSYEMNANMIRMQDQTLGRLISEMPRMT